MFDRDVDLYLLLEISNFIVVITRGFQVITCDCNPYTT